MIECDMCERQFEDDEYNSGTPERGLEVSLIGGYGLFHDDIENHCEKKIVLCHDCSLKVIRMIPKFADDKGWHSVSYKSEDYPLCCEYSWSFEEGTTNTIYGTKQHYKGE